MRNATFDATNRLWWTVVGGPAVTVTAVTDPPDAAGVVWGGPGQAGADAWQTIVATAAVAENQDIGAALNGPTQTVKIEVYDLTGLVSDLPIDQGVQNGMPQRKGYAGYVANNTALATATTDPVRAARLLRWSAGTRVSDTQRRFSVRSAGDQVVQVSLGTLSRSVRLHVCKWPVLRVQRIQFSGAGYHQVDIDTSGAFAGRWIRGRRRQSRLCYTRNTAVSLTVDLDVTTRPTEQETVQVTGTATFTTNAGANVQVQWTSAVVVPAGQAQVSFAAAVAGNNALHDVVEVYDPQTIAWTTDTPTPPTTIAIGTSSHVFYVTLAAPNGTPAYWTLLDYSCRNARGANNAQGLVAGLITAFDTTGPGITRKRDNRPLTYWNPRNATTASSTRDLLTVANGSGQCGAWAECLIDMYKLHGIMTGVKIYVAHDTCTASFQHEVIARTAADDVITNGQTAANAAVAAAGAGVGAAFAGPAAAHATVNAAAVAAAGSLVNGATAAGLVGAGQTARVAAANAVGVLLRATARAAADRIALLRPVPPPEVVAAAAAAAATARATGPEAAAAGAFAAGIAAGAPRGSASLGLGLFAGAGAGAGGGDAQMAVLAAVGAAMDGTAPAGIAAVAAAAAIAMRRAQAAGGGPEAIAAAGGAGAAAGVMAAGAAATPDQISQAIFWSLRILVLATPENQKIGFLVNNHQFDNPPVPNPTGFTHTLNTNCRKIAGVRGQNSDNPSHWFTNHFVVWSDTTNRYYDPSYGTGPFTTKRAWEDAALSGLFRVPLPDAGFAMASRLPAHANLVDLWRLTPAKARMP